ncbi:hypothetical protein D3C86_1510850 [compost metagenome]
MHLGDQLGAAVGADHHPRHRLAEAGAQPAHQRLAGLAVIQVVVDQHQFRRTVAGQQLRALLATARGLHLATPAAE